MWKDGKWALGLCWATHGLRDLGVFYLGSKVSAILWACPPFTCKNLIQMENDGLSGLPQKPRRVHCADMHRTHAGNLEINLLFSGFLISYKLCCLGAGLSAVDKCA